MIGPAGMVYNQGGQLDLDIQKAILLDSGDISEQVRDDDLARATESAARTLGGLSSSSCIATGVGIRQTQTSPCPGLV